MGLGLAVGYVLGAQAGRARYEQITQAAAAVMARPEVQQALESARAAAPAALRPALDNLGRPGGQGAGAADDASPDHGEASDAGDAGRSDGPLPDPLLPPAKSS